MIDPKEHVRNAMPLGGSGAQIISALGSILGSGVQGAKEKMGVERDPVVDIAIKKFEQNPGSPGMTPEEAEAFITAYGHRLFRIDPTNPEEYDEVFQAMTR